MSTLWNLAFRLVSGREPGNLWRQIALPAAILTSVVLTAATFSIFNVFHREDQRSLDRNFAEVVENGSSISESIPGLHVIAGLDYWHGDQFLLYWIEPANNAAYVLPPGIERMPEPGEAFVSPALAQEIEQYPELQARYPHYTVLDQRGVVSADELIAWIRPVDSEAFSEYSNRFFVTQFNADSKQPTVFRSALSSPTNFQQVYLFAGIVVFLPSLLLLMIGMSASSSVRESRIDLLQELGADRSWVMRLNLLEGLIFAAPILLVLLPLMQYMSSRLDTIPIVDRPIFTGDMRLGWLQVGLIALLTLGAIAAAAVGQVFIGGLRVDRRRRFWRAGAIAVRIALVGAALYVGIVLASSAAERGLIVFMANLLIVLAILPTIVGNLARPCGAVLARSGQLPMQIGGERLRYLSSASLRPFVGLAMAIVIVLLGFGQIAYLTARLPFVDHSRAPSSAEIRAAVPYLELQGAIAEKLPDTMTFPLFEPMAPVAGAIDAAPVYRFGVACEEVAEFLDVPASVCGTQDPKNASVFVPTFYGDAVFDPALANVPGNDEVVRPALMVVSHGTMDQVDSAVRSALPPALYPGLNIATPESFALKVPPQAPWIERGATAFVFLAGLAMVGALIDQAVSRRHHDRQLVAIGAPKPAILSIEALSFAVTAGIAVVAGAVFGVAELYMLRRLLAFAWTDVPFVPLFILLLVLLSLAAALIMSINVRIAFADGGKIQ